MTNSLTPDDLLRAPKVLLHDHLDGGLRPRTVVELAAETGYDGPARRPTRTSCRRWFVEAANSGSLERYLETFAHTVGVMQTREALVRVAAECAEDLAADGVVYAEVRYAPELHVERGPGAAGGRRGGQRGLPRGRAAGRGGRSRRSGSARCSPRCGTPPARWRSPSWRCATATTGVVGFDIAGAEAGFPPTRHLDAFEYLQRENAHFTIHAGEAFGLPSIWQAIQWCGADRLGHGVRIIDDITVGPDGDGHARAGSRPTCGTSGSRWRCARRPTCMTGAARVDRRAPDRAAARGCSFRVTVNTDNRLMSGTSMTQEFVQLADAFGYGLDDFRWFTVNAMKSAFIPFDERLALIDDVIKPGYAALQG